MSRAWVFDLDGTLVDSLPGIAHSLNHALSRCDQPMHDLRTVRRFIGDGAEMLVRRAIMRDDEKVHAAVLQHFREHYALHWQEGTVPYDGIGELLQSLARRGDRLAVLSNKPQAFTLEIVHSLFPHIFDPVLGQRPGIPHKPDPTGLREILQAPHWSGSKATMIGDSVMDLQTAHAAAIPSIAVTWGYHDREPLLSENPQMICDDVAELAHWMIDEF